MGAPTPSPRKHTPRPVTRAVSPPCSLLSGRISTLKDETGAVSSRATPEMGGRVGGGTGPPLGPTLCTLQFCTPSPQIFIDRDPTVFAPILNFLRTKELDPRLAWRVKDSPPPYPHREIPSSLQNVCLSSLIIFK